jgi:hypothetical protein
MALKSRAKASQAADRSDTTATSTSTSNGGATIENDDNDDKKKTETVLTSAPPPWHSVAIMLLMNICFIRLLPAWSVIDEIAVTETFTRRIFPELMSLKALATIRTLQALIVWATSFYILFVSTGYVFSTSYLPQSKLKCVPNRLAGLRGMYPFTSVAWNLLGVAFTLSAYISWSAVAMELRESGGAGNNVIDNLLLLLLKQPPSIWVSRTAILVWEVAAPNTLLVATVVRYVIWQGVLRAGADTSNLQQFRTLLMHNGNVLLALTEIALTGGLPVRWSEVALAPLLGIAYVFFSWHMMDKWNDPEHGPQFIYFFFDTTLGLTTSYALVGLLVVLLMFYMLFVSVEFLLAYMDGGWPFHVAFVVAVCSAVMRFRD